MTDPENTGSFLMALTDFPIIKPNFGTNPVTFFKEAQAELKKVNWPSRRELVELTAVVIGVSALVGVYLGGLDFVFTKIIEILLKR